MPLNILETVVGRKREKYLEYGTEVKLDDGSTEDTAGKTSVVVKTSVIGKTSVVAMLLDPAPG